MDRYRTLAELAERLNRETSLGPALRAGLQFTVDVFGLQSGWIWLVDPSEKNVYLATALQLPAPFTERPERMAGWCWCIDRYLAGELDTANNVSEIKCSRLEKLADAEGGLRYHASVPLLQGERRVGILNLLHDDNRQLSTDELDTLHNIGRVLADVIVRTTAYENSYQEGKATARREWGHRLERAWGPALEAIVLRLRAIGTEHPGGLDELTKVVDRIGHLSKGLREVAAELTDRQTGQTASRPAYPSVPLSDREKEVLAQVDQGLTNREIGETLFISERTVKFHVSAILQKLSAANRTDAVRIARQRGFFTNRK